MNILEIVLLIAVGLFFLLTLLFACVNLKNRFLQNQEENSEKKAQIESLKKDDVSLFIADIENE